MTHTSDDLIAVVEYGATARRDADRYSDRDICAITTMLTSWKEAMPERCRR